MLHRQILFGKEFKTPLCKIGKLVMEYGVIANNKTERSRVFYALYIGPSDSGTDHIVFKFSTKKFVRTPKCKFKSLTKDIITIADEIGSKEGIPDRNTVPEHAS